MMLKLCLIIFVSTINVIFTELIDLQNNVINIESENTQKFSVSEQIVCTKVLSCGEYHRAEWSRRQAKAFELANYSNQSM